MILRLEEGFARVVSARAFTVLAFRVGKSWTKMDLERVVAYLDKYEYFSMFRLVCSHLSVGTVFELFWFGEALKLGLWLKLLAMR